MTLDERLIDIEMAVANLQKTVDELNEVVIRQGREIDLLVKENKLLANMLKEENIKPLQEETPPPHY